MRPMFRTSLAAFLVAGLSAAALAQGVLEVLETELRIESRLFDKELQGYEEARLAERDARQTLSTQSRRLDAAIKGRRIPVEELRKMEGEATRAREVAYAAGRELADLRRQLYRRMWRLAELDAEIRREQGRRLVPPSALDGFWELEIQPTGEIGLLKLRAEGTLLTGTYRFSGGGQGSVRGTVADNRVNLERIDARNGLDSTLEGEFNPATRRIRGGWTAVDLSDGRLGGGTWTARKLSPAEQENLRTE